MPDNIKFRAWDESQKQMIYQGTQGVETLQSFIQQHGEKPLMLASSRVDSQGKKVFEGDLLKVPESHTYIGGIQEVCFFEDCFVSASTRFKDKKTANKWSLDFSLSRGAQVIGNIYEGNHNPSTAEEGNCAYFASLECDCTQGNCKSKPI